MKLLALGVLAASVLSLGTASCASARSAQGTPAAAGAKGAAASPLAQPPCPTGSPLPPGQGVAIDYVDMVRVGGREYDSLSPPPVDPPKVGRTLVTIRCAAGVPEDHGHGPVQVVDGGSTFVPVGSPVYEVVGVSTDCEVAAYQEGQLHLYFARGADGKTATGCSAH